MQVRPKSKVPDLTVDTVAHGAWSLANERPENFTVLVFYRGQH